MENLLNHTELSLNIRNNNLENALSTYKEKLKIFLSSSQDPHELKNLLYSMNIFIYTYFCISDSIALDDLCYNNLQCIDTYHSKDRLISLGEEIIKNYMEVINHTRTISENAMIKHALAYIHSNLEKKITLEKIATCIHISRNYLCYLFKKNTGFKFCEYVNLCRINLAKELLDKTSISLDVLSYKCGFNSQSHFSTTFKKYIGISPSEYRKRFSC